MTRVHRNVNVGGVVLPFLAFLGAVPLLWNRLVGWTDLAVLAGIYLPTALGVTVGFHRLLTHRAFETYGRSSTPLRCSARSRSRGP
jgi:stearoyl-CoA desaturase (Delta-9 desaturase)